MSVPHRQPEVAVWDSCPIVVLQAHLRINNVSLDWFRAESASPLADFQAMQIKNSFSKLGLGGLVIEIHSPESLPFLREKRFLPFQTDAAVPDIHWNYQIIEMDPQVSVKRDPQNDLRPASVKHLGNGNALLAAPQVRKRLEQAGNHLQWLTIEIHQGAVTILDFKENRADMFFCREFADELGDHGIGPAMLAPFLADFDACLLHASAVVRKGRTTVFLAPDEGGKTTAARLAPEGGIILSDDRVLVRRVAEEFRVYGTPWGLHMDGKLQAPLAGLFLLKKARNFSLVPLTTRALVSYLWEEFENISAILPGPLKKKAFDLVCAMAAQIPIWKMSFSKDYIDWDALDKKLTG